MPTPSIDIPQLRHTLLDWYDKQGRALPWRIRPEDRQAGQCADPYAIWLSEIMLQQTTVPHATPYWLRFLELWPSVHDLAQAPRDDVMREWAGLGYYARARNLHACAIQVAEELKGQFPDNYDGLLALPGIGDYTANAILAAAFNKPASVVDGNVERVITRLFRIQEKLPKSKTGIKKRAAKIADPSRSGDYAQAIMDLGATLCSPKSPDCPSCPWAWACQAKTEGDMERYPLKAKKKPKPMRHGIAWLVSRGDRVWLRQRADKGLLGGMMEVPSTPWTEEKNGRAGGDIPPFDADWADKGEVKHVFTHFELRLSVHCAEAAPTWEPDEGLWADTGKLHEYALPSVMKKVLKKEVISSL